MQTSHFGLHDAVLVKRHEHIVARWGVKNGRDSGALNGADWIPLCVSTRLSSIYSGRDCQITCSIFHLPSYLATWM